MLCAKPAQTGRARSAPGAAADVDRRDVGRAKDVGDCTSDMRDVDCDKLCFASGPHVFGSLLLGKGPRCGQ